MRLKKNFPLGRTKKLVVVKDQLPSLCRGWQMSTMDFTDYAAQKIQAGVGERPAMVTKEKGERGLMLVVVPRTYT